jgi:hypothetical protein
MLAMNLEHGMVGLCVSVATALIARAVVVQGRRWRLVVPAAALLVLGAYEIGMGRWEKTVHAAIRLDLMVEIPLVCVLVIWGVLAMVFSGDKKSTDQAESGESQKASHRTFRRD